MTRHDDPDTTTPIDTTTSGAPVDEYERQRRAEQQPAEPADKEAR